MDGLDSRASTGKTNGNESIVFRVIPAFGSFRRTVSRVCGAFLVHLFRPFRATDVGGAPFTQGGARRLRRLALPWAKLFCPFGAWRGLNAARFRRGMAVLLGMAVRSAPGLRGAIVLTPRRATL